MHKKDILTLEGPRNTVEALANTLGKRVKKSVETDVVFLGLVLVQ